MRRYVQIGFWAAIVNVLVILNTVPIFAQATAITSGLSYLQATQFTEGYWGEAS